MINKSVPFVNTRKVEFSIVLAIKCRSYFSARLILLCFTLQT